MAQAVSHRSVTAGALVRARVSPCGICSGQSGTEIGFSPSFSVFPSQYHSTVAPYSCIIWGMNNRPVGGRSLETVSPHQHEQQQEQEQYVYIRTKMISLGYSAR
jgi:hypothetical protein